MNREEAKRRLLDIERCTPIHTREDVRDFEALELAIKALEQEPKTDVLDKIRAEIEQRMDGYEHITKDAVFAIIDKYRKEQE